MQSHFHRHFVGFLSLGMVLISARARADIPPPDVCMDKGEMCDNAGPHADEPGYCRAATCTRGGPDGPITYDCLLCKLDSGAAGGAGASGGAGESGAGGGDTVGGTSGVGGSVAGHGGSSAGRGGTAPATGGTSAGHGGSASGQGGTGVATGGTAGQPMAGKAGTAGAGGSQAKPAPSDDDSGCGCRISPATGERGLAALMLLAGLAAVRRARRSPR